MINWQQQISYRVATLFTKCGHFSHLQLTLSSSSSDSDYCDDEEDLPKCKFSKCSKNVSRKFLTSFLINFTVDETIDYTKIDFEGRRVKARRAHEEIISSRYRQPNLAPRKPSLTVIVLFKKQSIICIHNL